MPEPQTLVIRCESEPVVSLLSQVRVLLAQAAEGLPELGEFLVHVGEPFPEIVRIDLERLPAGGTGELRVRLQPGPALLRLAAAVGARDVDLEISQSTGHISPRIEQGGTANQTPETSY